MNTKSINEIETATPFLLSRAAVPAAPYLAPHLKRAFGCVQILESGESQSEQLEVKMHILGRLAFSYQNKTEDITNKWLADRQIRRVVRQITSSYWFIRKVLKNAPDVVVVSPESVRDRLRQTLRSLCTQYDINVE